MTCSSSNCKNTIRQTLDYKVEKDLGARPPPRRRAPRGHRDAAAGAAGGARGGRGRGARRAALPHALGAAARHAPRLRRPLSWI